MQLNVGPRLLRQAAWMLVLAAALPACSDGNAAGASAAGSGKGSYVLVTQVRPETPEKSFPAARWGYKLCQAAARQMKVAVKPFPALPAGFVSERTTYASDGKRSMVRKVSYLIDGQATPDAGCAMRLASVTTASVIEGGRERSADTDKDGKVHVDEVEAAPPEPVRASSLEDRTQARRVNGVPLKCGSDGACIVDPDVVLVAQGRRPVQVSYRIDDPRTHGSALVVEPVSLTVGKPVDPALFVLEKSK